MVYYKKLPKTRLPGNTRRFGGKLFKQHDWYLYKLVANTTADNLKALGYNVRVTLRPKSKKRGGYPLYDLWYIWKRKG